MERNFDCASKILMLTWDSSPEAGATYYLVSENKGGDRTTYATSDNTYFIDTHCGEHYTLRTITQDSVCNSSLSQPLEIDSGTNVDNFALLAPSRACQVLPCSMDMPHPTLSNFFAFPTVPCPPSDLKPSVDCGSSKGRISWGPGIGGEIHMVEAIGSSGDKTSCSSNSTSCLLKLNCGSRYVATVIASNDICNSTSEATVVFESGN